MNNQSINLRLAGGLGNQLFELAFAIHVAYINSTTKIYIDDLSLGTYQAQHKNYLQELIGNNKTNLEIFAGRSMINRLRLAKIPFNSKLLPFISDLTKSKFWIKKTRYIFIDGYFIWAITGEELRKSVKLIKESFLLPRSASSPTECLVHIRGGDFNNLGWNPPEVHKFYNHAIDYFRSTGIESFRIITDDLVYAESICAKFEVENYVIEKNNMMIDFVKIMSANNKIISGSSFAMWAAMLGDNSPEVRIAISGNNAKQLKSVMNQSILIGIDY
jgi:hypothetical protein